jgi:hypothetical protein
MEPPLQARRLHPQHRAERQGGRRMRCRIASIAARDVEIMKRIIDENGLRQAE